ncbi:MAG TPA: histidine kinase [Bryobacteraceae bacterium]
MLYGVYFYLQGISPDCVKGLDRSEVMYYAFTSAVCFLPGCAACVYACLYILAPRLLIKKNYWGFAAGVMLLFGLTAGMNYFFSLLFFRMSCHCDVRSIPAMRVFAIGFLNSQNAMIAGGVVLGAKLAAGEYYQRRENLRLARLQTRNRLGALKAKAQPDYLLCQLGSIATHIRAGATDPPAMILQLSGLLRYWLYEGMEETISLEEECTTIQHFLRLEGARRCLPRVGDLRIEGDIRRVRLAPMILLPLLQAASSRCPEDRHGAPLTFLQLRIALKGSRLSFRLDRAYPASRDGLFEDSEPVQSAIERLELCYPGRHMLDIREIEEATSAEGNRRLLHLALDLDVSFAGAGARRGVSRPFTNLEAYEPT